MNADTKILSPPPLFFQVIFYIKKKIKISVYLPSLERLSLSALSSQSLSAANTSTTLGLVWAELLSRLSNIHRMGPKKVNKALRRTQHGGA